LNMKHILKAKKIIIVFLFASVALMIVAFDTLSSSGKSGYTGAYEEGTCLTCHGVAFMPAGLSISGIPALDTAGYIAGTTYTVSLTVSEPGRSKFGFDLEVLRDSLTNGGTLSLLPNAIDCKILTTAGRVNVLHTGTGNTSANAHTFKFLWTAPPAGFGAVTFYAVAVAANGNGVDDANDHPYQTSLLVPEKTTGIHEDESLDIKFSVFPNPASERIWLNYFLEKKAHVSAQLYSINGGIGYPLFSEIQVAGDKTKEVGLFQEILPGVYLLKLSVDGKIHFGKVIVF
jgi:hypothetical protein